MKKFNKKDLINLLIKKASGFYYTEELCEYEKTQNTTKSSLTAKTKASLVTPEAK